MTHSSSLFLVVSATTILLACGARNELPPSEDAAGGAGSDWTTGASPTGPSTSAETTGASAGGSNGVTTGSSSSSSSVGGSGGGGVGGGEGGGPTGCEPNCTGDHIFSQGFGENSQQVGTSVATDAGGNIVLTGYINGEVNFGGGELDTGPGGDVFVAKFDPFGNHIWSKLFGESGGHVGWAVGVDAAGNVFVTGEILEGTIDFGGGPLTGEGDIFVVKLDSSGNHIWSQRFGDAEAQSSRSLAIDSNGDVIVTGDLGGDVFVTKLDTSGDEIWSKRFGDAFEQLGQSVVTDPFGNVIVTGTYRGEPSFGGPALSASYVGFDLFVTKLDPSGNHIWSKGFGDFGDQNGVTTTDADGDVIVAGRSGGMVDFGGGMLLNDEDDVFVTKLDGASGDYVWAKMFVGNMNQAAKSVAVDAAGDVVLTGWFEEQVDFGGGALTSAGFWDIFVAKLDADGNHLWSQSFGSSDNLDEANCVTTDPDSNVIITGRFGGTVDFGGGDVAHAGSSDIFLVKLAP